MELRSNCCVRSRCVAAMHRSRQSDLGNRLQRGPRSPSRSVRSPARPAWRGRICSASNGEPSSLRAGPSRENAASEACGCSCRQPQATQLSHRPFERAGGTGRPLSRLHDAPRREPRPQSAGQARRSAQHQVTNLSRIRETTPRPQFPDYENALIGGLPAVEVIKDQARGSKASFWSWPSGGGPRSSRQPGAVLGCECREPRDHLGGQHLATDAARRVRRRCAVSSGGQYGCRPETCSSGSPYAQRDLGRRGHGQQHSEVATGQIRATTRRVAQERAEVEGLL